MPNKLPPYHAIIIANGTFVDFTPIVPLHTAVIIATDGAHDGCKKFNITPNIVVGDRDSIANPQDTEGYIYSADEHTTDLEKAILYCQEHALTQILVLGAFGGELDHSLNNLMSLAKHRDLNPNLQFSVLDPYGDTQWKIGIILGQETLRFLCSKNACISILPLPEAEVSTLGLQWELTNAQLMFGGFTSVRNRTIQETVAITCSMGKCIVLVDIEAFFFACR